MIFFCILVSFNTIYAIDGTLLSTVVSYNSSCRSFGCSVNFCVCGGVGQGFTRLVLGPVESNQQFYEIKRILDLLHWQLDCKGFWISRQQPVHYSHTASCFWTWIPTSSSQGREKILNGFCLATILEFSFLKLRITKATTPFIIHPP